MRPRGRARLAVGQVGEPPLATTVTLHCIRVHYMRQVGKPVLANIYYITILQYIIVHHIAPHHMTERGRRVAARKRTFYLHYMRFHFLHHIPAGVKRAQFV